MKGALQEMQIQGRGDVSLGAWRCEALPAAYTPSNAFQLCTVPWAACFTSNIWC